MTRAFYRLGLIRLGVALFPVAIGRWGLDLPTPLQTFNLVHHPETGGMPEKLAIAEDRLAKILPDGKSEGRRWVKHKLYLAHGDSDNPVALAMATALFANGLKFLSILGSGSG